MHSPRANSSSNVSWIKKDYFDFDAADVLPYINWAKHLYPLGKVGEWNAGNSAYSGSEMLEKHLRMYASGIQTPVEARDSSHDNAAAFILDSDTDSAYLTKLFYKASSRSQTNLLVIGNLSSPISLLLDVSCYRFLYIHMSDYYR